MNNSFYFVDNIESIKKIQKKNKFSKNIVWVTTSFAVIEFLKSNKLNYLNPEENFNNDFKNKLAKIVHRILIDFFNLLKREKGMENNFELQKLFGTDFSNTFFLLIYKAHLIFLVKKTMKKNDKLFSLGNGKIKNFNNLTMRFSRLDNIFSILAANTNVGVTNIHEQNNQNLLNEIESYSKSRKMKPLEKFISLLNNTTSSFFYKFWFKFQNRRFNKVNSNDNHKKAFVYKNCETIQEIFLDQLSRGYKFKLLPSLKIVEKKKKLSKKININKIRNIFFKLFYKELKKNNIKNNEMILISGQFFLERLINFLIYFQRVSPGYIKYFDKIKSIISKKDVIYSNYFSQPHERLFALYALNSGINTYAFEHGITLGLSKHANNFVLHHPAYPIALANHGIYNSKESINIISQKNKKQKKIFSGLPIIATQIKFLSLQKYLIKKFLNISFNKRVIMFVTETERNNFIYGPYSNNDYQFCNETIEIVDFLCKNYSKSLIILKLYPARRYINSFDFAHLENKYKNLKIIKDFDFRFLRVVADKIYLQGAQSTLGWAIGSNIPTFLFKRKSTPLNEKTLKLKKIKKIKSKNMISGIYKVNLKIPSKKFNLEIDR